MSRQNSVDEARITRSGTRWRFGKGSGFVIIELGRPCKVGGYRAILPPPIVLLKASSCSRRLVIRRGSSKSFSGSLAFVYIAFLLFLSMPNACSFPSRFLSFTLMRLFIFRSPCSRSHSIHSSRARTYLYVQSGPTFEQGRGVEPTRVHNSRAHAKTKKYEMVRYIIRVSVGEFKVVEQSVRL